MHNNNTKYPVINGAAPYMHIQPHCDQPLLKHPQTYPYQQTSRQNQRGEMQLNALRQLIDRQKKKASLYKTEMCRSLEEEGKCRYGDKVKYYNE